MPRIWVCERTVPMATGTLNIQVLAVVPLRQPEEQLVCSKRCAGRKTISAGNKSEGGGSTKQSFPILLAPKFSIYRSSHPFCFSLSFLGNQRKTYIYRGWANNIERQHTRDRGSFVYCNLSLPPSSYIFVYRFSSLSIPLVSPSISLCVWIVILFSKERWYT